MVRGIRRTLGKKGSFCGSTPCSSSQEQLVVLGWDQLRLGGGGVRSCWWQHLTTAGCRKLGSFSSSSVKECVSLGQLLFPSSPRLINPLSRHAVRGGWAGGGPLPLCWWSFLCELLLMSRAGIPSWSNFVTPYWRRERARDTLVLCRCQLRSEPWLCHPKSQWLHSETLQQQQRLWSCQLCVLLGLEGKLSIPKF